MNITSEKILKENNPKIAFVNESFLVDHSKKGRSGQAASAPVRRFFILHWAIPVTSGIRYTRKKEEPACPSSSCPVISIKQSSRVPHP